LHAPPHIVKIGPPPVTRVTYVKQTRIQPAAITFNHEGTPVSREFDDVYFSNDNGLEETRHVFLNGNQLPERFALHPRPLMIVAESGFGTGLNFLTLWQAFRDFRRAHPEAPLRRLHFISFEKHPLTPADLRAAHARWPELRDMAQQLQEQWPLPLPGCQRVILDEGAVTLDLWYGDINHTLSCLDDSLQGQVDAWFLDGFAPSRNPDMWTPTLFHGMARLARAGGTLSTFTAAGFVRRGLEAAGFRMQKRKGFGRKREMLTGILPQALPALIQTPWYARDAAHGRPETAIIGGGVASALLALALLRRGWQVTLYCQDERPAAGASGNRQGALYPLLNGHDPALTQFFPAAFTFARRCYDTLPFTFEHAWCGVTQLGWDDKSRRKIARMLTLDLPPELAHAVDAQQSAALCGLETACEGITYPAGGWLYPAQLTAAALELAQQQGLALHYRKEAAGLLPDGDSWRITFTSGETQTHQSVALANGHRLDQFAQTTRLPCYSVGGQVSHIPTTPALKELRQVLCYDGYLTPCNPANQRHCIGASYHRGAAQAIYSAEDQDNNRQRLIHCLPQQRWVYEVDVSAGEARCGIRCAIRDHLPLVGNVPNYAATLESYASLDTQAITPEQVAQAPVYRNLFMLGALGSRGLCSAPLAAELLAAQMSAEPLPLDAQTLAALSPNRFWVRKLLKGKQVKTARAGA